MQTISTSILHTIIMNAMQMLKDEWKKTNMPKSWHRMETGKTTFGVFLKQGNIFFSATYHFIILKGMIFFLQL